MTVVGPYPDRDISTVSAYWPGLLCCRVQLRVRCKSITAVGSIHYLRGLSKSPPIMIILADLNFDLNFYSKFVCSVTYAEEHCYAKYIQLTFN